ncbi:Localization factor PodJL [bacterium HR40]|nr:Localization factor PodJL [bacterium HR40]
MSESPRMPERSPAEDRTGEGGGAPVSSDRQSQEPVAGGDSGPQDDAALRLARDRACFRQLQARAEQGDPEAMYLLGVCYAQGRGVAADQTAAVDWFKKATVLGHLKAKISLGYCYASGKGVKRDLEIAYILLREAADAGDRDAFELAERVAQRLHGEQLARLEKKIRQRRILARAGRPQAPPATDEIVLENG